MLRVKLVKSLIGQVPKNVRTVRGLGLNKVSSTADHNDTPQIRGMIHHVKHLVVVEEVSGEVAKSKKPVKAAAKPASVPKPKPEPAAAVAPKAPAAPKPKAAAAKPKAPAKPKKDTKDKA